MCGRHLQIPLSGKRIKLAILNVDKQVDRSQGVHRGHFTPRWLRSHQDPVLLQVLQVLTPSHHGLKLMAMGKLHGARPSLSVKGSAKSSRSQVGKLHGAHPLTLAQHQKYQHAAGVAHNRAM